MSALLGGLGGAVEDQQQGRAGAHAEQQGDPQSGPTVEVVGDVEGSVEGDAAGAEHGAHQAHGRDQGHVLPALAGDHEALVAVDRPERHHHQADQPGRGHLREQTDHQQRAHSHLGGGGQGGVDLAGAHPHRLEPAAGAGDAPAPERLVVAVDEDHHPQRGPQDHQGDVEHPGAFVLEVLGEEVY